VFLPYGESILVGNSESEIFNSYYCIFLGMSFNVRARVKIWNIGTLWCLCNIGTLWCLCNTGTLWCLCNIGTLRCLIIRVIRVCGVLWKSWLNSANACCHSVQNICLPDYNLKNTKIKIYRTIILPVVLYMYVTWSLTLREERRLRVFEYWVLRRIFGSPEGRGNRGVERTTNWGA
jgi:hypothetical protein